MADRDDRNLVGIPIGCGLFVPVEVLEGKTEAEFRAEIRAAQGKAILVGLARVIPVLIATFLWL